MFWNRVYVVVWRLPAIDLEYRVAKSLTRRGAERKLQRYQRRYPNRNLRIERIRIV